MAHLICPAPAKLNLFLHITGRRADGYHLLQTVFQFLDYCDELQFTLREDGQLQLTPSLANIAPHDNLIYRAASLLQQQSRCRLGANISVTKKIPLGGGLGGGSSDAAATLLALNQLWQLGLSLTDLADIGLQLGADIPIFVMGQAAWAEGVGEKFTLISLPEPWYVVIIPPCEVATAKIFSHTQLTRDSSPIKIQEFTEGHIRNDCEPLVRNLYPEVAAALDWLGQYTQAMLTGTGACIFGRFVERQAAEAVLAKLPETFSGFIAKGLNHSPLHRVLGYDNQNWGVAKR